MIRLSITEVKAINEWIIMHLNLLLLHEFKLSSQHGDEFSLVSQFILFPHLIYTVYEYITAYIFLQIIFTNSRVGDEENMPSTIF